MTQDEEFVIDYSAEEFDTTSSCCLPRNREEYETWKEEMKKPDGERNHGQWILKNLGTADMPILVRF